MVSDFFRKTVPYLRCSNWESPAADHCSAARNSQQVLNNAFGAAPVHPAYVLTRDLAVIIVIIKRYKKIKLEWTLLLLLLHKTVM